MSGGRFDHKQGTILDIAAYIQYEIERSGQPKTKDELWAPEEYYEKYPEELVNYKRPDHIIAEFEKAIDYLKKAYVYAQRVDWLLSGDDGEDSFIERLKEDLSEENFKKLIDGRSFYFR